MKLQDQVCSADQAISLQKLGIEQDSLFYWQISPDAKENIVTRQYRDTIEKILPGCNLFYSAFTVAELGGMLGDFLSEVNFWDNSKSEAWHRAEILIDHITEKPQHSESRIKMVNDRLEA